MEEINDRLHVQLLNFRQNQWADWVKQRKPFSVLFELTPSCNMNCIHCYLQNVHSSSQLSYEEIIEILDILHEKSILFLVLSGGEILTRPDFSKIYLYAKRKGFLIELFTNGLAFNDDIIQMLKKYPPLFVDITLYGSCEETYHKVTRVKGAFDKVINNLHALKDAGIHLSLRTPVMKETVHEMSAMKAIADELDVPFVCTFEMCPTIDNDTAPQDHRVSLETMLKYEFDNYLEQVNRNERKDAPPSDDIIQSLKNNCIFACNVGLNSFVIDYHGNMCPCMKLKHRGKKLSADNYDEIWESFAVYNRMKASPSYKCSSCDSRYYCDVCPAEMDMMFHDYEFRTDEMCAPAKLRKSFYFKEKSYEDIMISEKKGAENGVQEA